MSTINGSQGNRPVSGNRPVDSNNSDYNVGQSNNVNPRDVEAHFQNIYRLNSFNDISNYVQQNIVNPLNGQSEVNTVIANLIDDVGQNNPQLAALIYHAADETLRLTVLNPSQSGNRRLQVENIERPIPDHVFREIALASQGVSGYQSNYFNNANTNNNNNYNDDNYNGGNNYDNNYDNSPPPQQGRASDRRASDRRSPERSPPTTPPPEPSPVSFLPQGILDYLPEGTDPADLDKTVIIDITTGEQVRERDFRLNTPEGLAEYEEVLDRSITIYTEGRRDGLIDVNDTATTADALVDYITSPYSNDISPDGLEDILDNLTFNQQADILLLAQDDIYDSDNPADKIKLNRFLNSNSNDKLDKKIKELLEYNLDGGNSGSPNLFLNNIFKNNPSSRLNDININQISDKLAEQLDTYLKLKEEDRDPKYLNFITEAIEKLSNAHPDNIDKGSISTLLQQTLEKTSSGKQEVAKEILSDLSHNAGVTTFHATSLDTGQSLVSQFGEYIYTDNTGRDTSFDSETTDGDFATFEKEIIALITGDHESLSDYKDDFISQAVIASQVADMIVSLSTEQQKSILDKLAGQENILNKLDHLASLSGDSGTNLNEILEELRVRDAINALKDIDDPEALGAEFSEIIQDFDNPSDPVEMQKTIDKIILSESDIFKDMTAIEASTFLSTIRKSLTDDNVANVDTILDNLTNSLNLHGISFETGTDGEKLSAEQVSDPVKLFSNKLTDHSKEMTAEDVEKFFDLLTAEQISDPALFADLLKDNQTFSSKAEYDNFQATLKNILTEIDNRADYDDDKDALEIARTNITTLLLENEPIFSENAPEKLESRHASYLAYLTTEDSASSAELISLLDRSTIAENEKFTAHLANNVLEEGIEKDGSNNKIVIETQKGLTSEESTEFEAAITNEQINQATNNGTVVTFEQAQDNYKNLLETFGYSFTSNSLTGNRVETPDWNQLSETQLDAIEGQVAGMILNSDSTDDTKQIIQSLGLNIIPVQLSAYRLLGRSIIEAVAESNGNKQEALIKYVTDFTKQFADSGDSQRTALEHFMTALGGEFKGRDTETWNINIDDVYNALVDKDSSLFKDRVGARSSRKNDYRQSIAGKFRDTVNS